MDANHSIEYKLTGPGVIAGIGNGDLTSTDGYLANPRRVHQGRSILVIRSTGQPGRISLEARSPELKTGHIVIRTE
jgi:beta-galactosidase